MSNSIPQIFKSYKDKIMNLETDLKEGIISFISGIVLLLFLPFFQNYINYYWIYAIIIDFIVYSFLLVGKFNFRFNSYVTIGVGSIFTSNSLILRVTRFCLYGVIVQIIFFNRIISFFNILMVVFILTFTIYVFFNLYVENNSTTLAPIQKFLVKYDNIIKIFIIISCLAILGIMMRLYNIYSIGGWDEGWYSDVTYRMFQTQNWFQPLYFDDFSQTYKLFDKPPLMFILGSVGIALFGYSTLAIKWTMGVFSGLMGVAGYLIYSHQQRNKQSKFISPLLRSEKEQSEYSKHFDKPEEFEKTRDGKFVGIIFGLSMSVTWFLAFYGRTAYIDPAIVAITAFTALFAVKAIDHWFYGNTRRAYVYIVLTAFINMLDLFAKAWQGLIVGPSIAIYLFARYYEYYVPKQNFYEFLYSVKTFFKNNSINAKLMAGISSLLTILLFNNLLPKLDNKKTICYQASANTCYTFVPNFSFSLLGLTIQYWSIFIAIFVFFGVVSISEFILRNESVPYLLTNVDNTTDEKTINTNSRVNKETNSISLYLFFMSVFTGLISSIIGEMGFEFTYDRFYKALTEVFQTYFTYDNVMANRTFYGELIDGSLSVVFSGFITLLFIWILYIIMTAALDTFIRFVNKQQLFTNPFSRKIVAEWSFLFPLIPFGIVLGYWLFFLLFNGDIFNRSSQNLMIAGTLLSVLAYLIASLFIDGLKQFIQRNEKNNEMINLYQNWIKEAEKFLIFLTVTSILIILSFYPFLAWIEYMDKYMVCITTTGAAACAKGTYIIRLPGELSNSGIPEGTLTYTWLFFEYYINWRYTGSGSQYSVVDSLGGLISPLFLACLPFFLTGIYALIKKRDYATLAFYTSWVFIALITFIPAVFQLNYYYLAIFFPYFGITSYGLFWTLRKTPSNLNFKNIMEKLLLSIPILLLIFFSLVFFPLVNQSFFLQSSQNFNFFLVACIFVVGGFLVCTVFFIRSIPEAFSLAFIIFYLYRNLIDVGIGNTDSEFLIMTAILIGIVIFTVKDRIPIGSAFFLLLIMLSAVSSTAWWAHYKSFDDDQYEQMAEFILRHVGGDKNGSTWVFPDAGARYSMRYYLHGLRLDSDFHDHNYYGYPMDFNNSDTLLNYLIQYPQVKYFVVINQTYGNNVPPTSAYSVSYQWLKTHFVLVDSLFNKPSWQRVHLFVNETVLTQADWNRLNLQT